VDLFEPGSGSQVHDFNLGIPPSGLFWTGTIDDHEFRIDHRGRRAVLELRDMPVLDSFQFLGPNVIPATNSLRVEWEATGPRVARGEGASVPPTDPAAFRGRFAFARATGRFTGEELGFAFESNRGVSSDSGFAELGTERNGAFL
jgi:hypothetical protein